MNQNSTISKLEPDEYYEPLLKAISCTSFKFQLII